jgi:hypothetical protein
MTGRELLDSAQIPGFIRFREPIWASPACYMRLYVTEHGIGPWGHLFDRPTQQAIGEPTPQVFPTFGRAFMIEPLLNVIVEPYTGELDPADRP